MISLKAKPVIEGECCGELFLVDKRISFYGEVDPATGEVRGVEGSFKGKVLAIRGTRGSTVGSYIVYSLKKHGVAPKCIVVEDAEPILIVGCIIAEIPLVKVEGFNELVKAFSLGFKRARLVSERGALIIE
ncbi:MAG: DUF126 domain-containing protein [Desulfurococcaceae archaeon]